MLMTGAIAGSPRNRGDGVSRGGIVEESTLLAAFERACRRWADRTALVHDRRAITYGQLWTAALAQAAWYRGLGVRPGDRVVTSLSNRPEHLVSVAAAWACGAVHVGVDHTLTVPELSWLTGHTGAAALVVGPDHPHLDGLAAAGAPRVLRVDQVPRLEAAATFQAAVPAPDDPALIIFSSGTTGRPKGAVARHGRFAAGWLGIAGAVGFRPDDVHLGQVPISHGYGLQLAMMALLSGGTLVLMERFSAGAALDLIEERRVTVLNGTPSHYIGVLGAVERRQAAGREPGAASLRVGIGSADHFPRRLLVRIFDELRMDFMNMYGSNVGLGVATMDRALMLRGSVGPTTADLVAIVDAAHRPLPPGLTGEVALRFQQGDAGLWSRPEGGDPMLDEVGGWYYTGDLGRLDAEGNLFLSGRLKHQVNRGGMKVDPAEVAGELYACPGVTDAAVIGMPDDFLGEIVCACVVPSPGEPPPALEAVRRLLGTRLAPHKLPEQLCFVDEIPRTPNGKVEIEILRERALAGGRCERVARGRPSAAGAASPGISAPALDEAAVAAAVPGFRRRLERVRADLPGRVPAVLDGLLRAAAEHVAAMAAEPPPEDPGAARFLRPSLAVATPELREAFESLRLPPAPSGESREVSFPEALGLIADGLGALHHDADAAERVVYRVLLACALRGLIPHEHLPRGRDLSMAAIALACLARAQRDTVLHVGRPGFLTDDLLAGLREEAEASRAGAIVIHHWCIAELGPVAEGLAASSQLRALVSDLAGWPMEATGTGKYVYCDEHTSGVGVHIHTQPFAVNVELKLTHEHPGREPARLVLWPPHLRKQPLDVRPGELAAWYAGGLPHLREDPGPGERMTAVSVFFEPVRG
jgi:acyl-CoA synthetase (AMP-forming)/AMP-acid ligase II